MVFHQLEGHQKFWNFIANDFETATDLNPSQTGMAIVENVVITQT